MRIVRDVGNDRPRFIAMLPQERDVVRGQFVGRLHAESAAVLQPKRTAATLRVPAAAPPPSSPRQTHRGRFTTSEDPGAAILVDLFHDSHSENLPNHRARARVGPAHSHRTWGKGKRCAFPLCNRATLQLGSPAGPVRAGGGGRPVEDRRRPISWVDCAWSPSSADSHRSTPLSRAETRCLCPRPTPSRRRRASQVAHRSVQLHDGRDRLTHGGADSGLHGHIAPWIVPIVESSPEGIWPVTRVTSQFGGLRHSQSYRAPEALAEIERWLSDVQVTASRDLIRTTTTTSNASGRR